MAKDHYGNGKMAVGNSRLWLDGRKMERKM